MLGAGQGGGEGRVASGSVFLVAGERTVAGGGAPSAFPEATLRPKSSRL